MRRPELSRQDEREQLGDWFRLVRAESHILREQPWLLFQQAANQPESTAPAQLARLRSEAGLEPRPWLRWINRRRRLSPCLMTLVGHEASVTSLLPAPNGRHLVTLDRSGVIKLWDLEDGRAISTWEAHSDAYRSALAFAPDGSCFISAGRDGIKAWDLNGVRHGQLSEDSAKWHDGSMRLAAFLDPNGRPLVSDGASVWDIETGNSIPTLPMEPSEVPVAVSQDGRLIVSVRADRVLNFWNLTNGEMSFSVCEYPGEAIGLFKTRNGTRLILRESDETLTVWDAENSRVVSTLSGHQGRVHIVTASPDGSRIVAASSSRTAAASEHVMTMWEATSGQLVCALKGHVDRVSALATSSDGRQVISGGSDRLIKVWNVETPDDWTDDHRGSALSVSIAPNGRFITSASSDSELRLWTAASGRLLNTLKGHSGWVMAAAITPDSRRVVSVSLDSTIATWDATTGRCVWQRRALGSGKSGQLYSLAITPDGKHIACGGAGGTVTIWKADTGEVRHLMKCKGDVRIIAATPDSQRFVVAGGSHGVLIWDIESGERVRGFEGGHIDVVTRLAMTPSGRSMVTTDLSNLVTLWDMEGGVRKQTFIDPAPPPDHGQSDLVVAITFDGSHIITGGLDGRIRDWDVERGQIQWEIQAHSRGLMSLALTPDGRYLVSGGHDYQVKVWNVSTGEPIGSLFAGARIHSLALQGRLIAVASSLGVVVLLELCNLDIGLPVVALHKTAGGFVFRCPHCGVEADATDSHPGKEAKCARCSTSVTGSLA